MDLVDLLNEKGINYKKSNNPSEILITCTSGEHVDKDPSLSYNLEKDMFHCWSCGFKGSKRKFLESIGISSEITFETKQAFKIQKLKNKLQKLIEANECNMPTEYRGWTQGFRGIDEKTVKEFKMFTTSEMGFEDYVCIPVYQFGKLKFIEGRYRFNSKNKPKYNRKPAGVNVSNIAFPLDKLEDKSKVIIVEGIFDMLNMWQHGFRNVLCVFGTQNFNEQKVKLFDDIGIRNVQIMFDGDAAGQSAAAKVRNLLTKNNISSSIIKLPLGKDPGILVPDEINSLLSNG
jgi:DNA primase